jgi:hypothetical protein
MKNIFLSMLIFSISILKIYSQSISPLESSEQCPGINITFTVTIAAQSVQSVQPKALNVNPTVIQQPFNISSSGGNVTFNFVGRFADYNNKQTFTVYYTNSNSQSVTKDFTFPKIKSLLTANSFSQIYPSPTSITAPRCETNNFNISFSNVQYGNPFEAPPIGYGTVTNYEYLLPAGWSMNSTTSSGSDWIAGGNNVTVTSDLSNGVNGAIRIRPVNTACGSGLQPGQEAIVAISRPEPTLTITGTQYYICSGCTNFTINGMPSGASVQWSLSNTTDAYINGCSTCSTVDVCRNTTANTVVVLTATITHCTFIYTQTRNITLGTGTNSINFTQKDVTCENGPYFFGAVAAVPSATNYAWYSKDESNPSNPFVLKQSENSNTADFPLGYSYGNNYYTIRVVATNSCGSFQSIDEDGYIFAPDCSGGRGLRIITSPNPTSNTMIVQVVDESGKPSVNQNKKFYELQLTDKLGTVLRQQKYNKGTNQAAINLSGLQADLYFLRVWDGKKWTTKTVVKK